MRNPFKRKALTASPSVVEAAANQQANFAIPLAVNAQINAAFMQMQAASYGFMYEHQPAVRTVIDYIARNVSQLGLHLYERVGDDEREERGDHPAAELMRHPNPQTAEKQFISDCVTSFLIYENAYVLKLRPSPGDPITLIKIPSQNVAVLGSSFYSVDAYRVFRSDGSFIEPDILPRDMFHWRGQTANDPRVGFSRLETLRLALIEEATTQAANTELAKSGLRQQGYIKRPLDAADWHSDGGYQRFVEQWAAARKDQNRKDPVLEESMEWEPMGISPKDAEMLDSRRFTREEVNRAYGMENVPPADDEERKQFYADVLPPVCEAFCDWLKLQLLEQEFGEDDFYFEFNLNEKQITDDRLKTLTSAAGAPILLRDEARAMINLPKVDGGDELIVPLNVTEGSKPSIDVMPPQNLIGPPQDGSHRPELPMPAGAAASLSPTKAFEDTLLHWARRYENAVKSAGMASAERGAERWPKELAKDLREIAPGMDAYTEASEFIIEVRKRIGEAETGNGDPFKPVYALIPRYAAKFSRSVNGNIETLKALNVPWEMIWEQAGFSEAEIDRMRALNLAESLSARESELD